MALGTRALNLAFCGVVLCATQGTSCGTPPPTTPPLVSARYGSPHDLGSSVAVAVYRYAYAYTDLSPAAIEFSITSAPDVASVVGGVDMTHSIDGSTLGTEPNAYVYVKNGSGAIHQYRVVLDWSYLLDGENWKTLHPISAAAATTLRAHQKM
jgi:hypothetical protein